MAKLSVVLATYNEEENIEECLKSVKDIADEICIVDGTSDDKTVSIAKKYTSKIIVTDNPQIFHINKQKAIDMASNDWILQLDADERVSADLAAEIKEIIKSNPRENGYWIPRKNWFLGRFLMKGGQYPDYTLRLYRTGQGRLPMKDVHEQAIVDGSVGYLKHPLIHIADPKFNRYLKRFNRYTSLMAVQIQKDKNLKNPLIFFRYLIFYPLKWFMLTYLRHKGFMDGWQGFVFSLFSALRFPVSYIKGVLI